MGPLNSNERKLYAKDLDAAIEANGCIIAGQNIHLLLVASYFLSNLVFHIYLT